MSSNLTLAEELLSIPTDGPDTSEPGSFENYTCISFLKLQSVLLMLNYCIDSVVSQQKRAHKKPIPAAFMSCP